MPSPPAFGALPRCDCGRLVSTDCISTYRSTERRYVSYRCECGQEWTDCLDDVDRGERVTADELLTVHEALQAWEGPLTQLLEGGVT